LHEFGNKGCVTVPLSCDVAILDQDVFSLNITEISKPLPESLDLRPAIGDVAATPGQISYAWDFRRLLRFSGKAKR
jgi:hypothetical protein